MTAATFICTGLTRRSLCVSRKYLKELQCGCIGLCTECCAHGVEETSRMVREELLLAWSQAEVRLKQVTCKKMGLSEVFLVAICIHGFTRQ